MGKQSSEANHLTNDLAHCDIAIVGGGMVGLSVARLLAQIKPELHIVLLDSHPIGGGGKHYQPSFDARSTAISSNSVDILGAIGVWSRIAEHAAAINEVQVSDKGHFGQAAFSSHENQNKALGYVVENAWLGTALLEGLAQVENIALYSSISVERLTMRADCVELSLAPKDLEQRSASSKLSARLVIAADGAGSSIRQHLGIQADRHDYRQVAMIANIESQEDHRGRAFERFTSQGPLALLPLVPSAENPKASRSALVWTHPQSKLEALKQMDEAQCIDALQSAFGFRLGRITRLGERHYYSLEKLIAREQVRSRLVIMGNAAHYLHPVAGQGFNLALRDAQCLAKVIASANTADEDFALLANLQTYLDLQAADQATTVGASHIFNLLFSTAKPSAEIVRNLGLIGMNIAPPARRFFFSQMMGKGKKQLPRW